MVCFALFIVYALTIVVALVFSVLGAIALVVLIPAVIGGFVFSWFPPTEVIAGICWAVALVAFGCVLGFFGVAFLHWMIALGIRRFAIWIGCSRAPFDAAWPEAVFGGPTPP